MKRELSAFGKKCIKEYTDAVKAVENIGACVPYDSRSRTEAIQRRSEALKYLEDYIIELEDKP